MNTDSHSHLSEQSLPYIEKDEIYTLACATNPIESKTILKMSENSKFIYPTFALHPNFSSQYKVQQMLPFFEKTNIIGEIGMDSFWCDIDLKIQESVFIEQLEYAQKSNKTVILHTKGQEKEIAKIISKYSMPCIIHWYSCNNYLNKFKDRDCFFTVGPSIIAKDSTIIEIVKDLPLNRLMIETDGIEAVNWALNTNFNESFINGVLNSIILEIAQIKKVDFNEVKLQIQKNFFTFFTK